MNIAKSGNQWSNPQFVRYPNLQQHLATSLNKEKFIHRYPEPVEKPLSWRSVKGFEK